MAESFFFVCVVILNLREEMLCAHQILDFVSFAGMKTLF